MRTNVQLPKFDTLVALYKKDPAAFNEFRKKFLDDEVSAAPPEKQAALRRTICRIELAREQAETPLEAAISAYAMMCESTIRLRAEINNLRYITSGIQASMIIENVRQDTLSFLKMKGMR